MSSANRGIWASVLIRTVGGAPGSLKFRPETRLLLEADGSLLKFEPDEASEDMGDAVTEDFEVGGPILGHSPMAGGGIPTASHVVKLCI